MYCQIVYFRDALATLFPIEKAWTLNVAPITYQFQTSNHFCDAAFVDEVLRGASHDKLDELLKIYAGTEDIETGLQKMQDIVDQASAG